MDASASATKHVSVFVSLLSCVLLGTPAQSASARHTVSEHGTRPATAEVGAIAMPEATISATPLRHSWVQAQRGATPAGRATASSPSHRPLRVYRLQTTGPFKVSLPVTTETDRATYRGADGKWRPITGRVSGGALHLEFGAQDIANGRTVLLIGDPGSVDLDDRQPPEVLRFEVDGVSHGGIDTVALGGVETSPAAVLIEVADVLNPLRRKSCRLMANGRSIDLDGPGVALTFAGPKKAILKLDIASFLNSVQRRNTITFTIDDCAIDEQALTCSLTFGHAPSRRLEDGRIVSVDTVTSDVGWEDWTVIFDGVRMGSSDGTTRGRTWLSENNKLPHWVRVEFPEPRRVQEVVISWAFWEAFRSSARYSVQTWKDGKWHTQVEVKGQETTQVSRHRFAPITTEAIRVWQPPVSGHPNEPHYMWISELEIPE